VLALSGPASTRAADVTATVCPTLISLSLSASSVAYGIQDLNVTNLVPTPSSVTITNNGNVAENFLVKGADATTTGGTWTLAATAGTNLYVHKSSPDNSVFTALTTTNATLKTNVAADTACKGTAGDGGTQALHLKMDTPVISAVQGEYSTTVTVTAVAN